MHSHRCGVVVGIRNRHGVFTGSRHLQDAAYHGHLGAGAGPRRDVLAGHRHAVDGHRNVNQFDLLIDVDKNVAVGLGHDEILAFRRGRETENGKGGHAKNETANQG